MNKPDIKEREEPLSTYHTPPPPPLEKKINNLISILGKELLEGLFDLLNFTQGPRVRDRISHGEIGPKDISPSLSYHILHLSLLVLMCGEVDRVEEESRVARNSRSSSSNSVDLVTTTTTNNNNPHSIHPSTCLSVEAKNSIRVLKKWISGYKAQFHPTSLLHQSLLTSTSLLSDWREWKRVERSEVDYVEWEEQNVEVEMMEGVEEGRKGREGRIECKVKNSDYVEEMIEKVESGRKNINKQIEKKEKRAEEVEETHNKTTNKKNLIIKPNIKITFPPLPPTHSILTLTQTPTLITQVRLLDYHVLYRPKSELEMVSILRRITTNTLSTLYNIRESLSLKHTQFTEKRMRSRQRETYKRQLNAVPKIIYNCSLTLQTVYLIFKSIGSIQCLRQDHFSRLLRLLKVVLKAMENVASQIDLQTNRWDEAACVSCVNVRFILGNLCH